MELPHSFVFVAEVMVSPLNEVAHQPYRKERDNIVSITMYRIAERLVTGGDACDFRGERVFSNIVLCFPVFPNVFSCFAVFVQYLPIVSIYMKSVTHRCDHDF